MRLKCKFCNSEYEETLTNCPNCGAPNENVKKTAESGPRTLEELKDWFYNKHGLTSSKTHIYVGEDCKEAAVFGMYKDKNTGDFVVYKNKANGERAIRYQGVDEQYAVNELYQLIQRQALRNGVDLNGALNPGKITNRNSALNGKNNSSGNYSNNRRNNPNFVISCIIFIIFMVVIHIIGDMNGWRTTSSSSGRSSGSSYSRDYDWGSSWDDDDDDWDSDDSWDSGDWDSDWGYYIDPDNKKIYLMNNNKGEIKILWD